MNDFGRNDFSDTLRVLMEMPVAKVEPNKPEIGDFGGGSAKAKLAGDKKSQQKTEKEISTLLVEFENKWNTTKENIRGALNSCIAAVKAHKANIGDATIDNQATTDAQARERAIGGVSKDRVGGLATSTSAGAMEPGTNRTEPSAKNPQGLLKQATFGDNLTGLDATTKISTAGPVKDRATADFKKLGGKGGASPATVRAGTEKRFKPKKKI